VPLELIIKGKREKLTDEEIQKLIDENYHHYEDSIVVGAGGTSNSQEYAVVGGVAHHHQKDQSVIYYNGKVYDERKRAVYGIQPSKQQF
jgi:hypothetical protein